MTDVDIIWNDYRGALRAFLRSRVSDPDDVDDLLQDILVKTHRELPNLRDDERLKSWLFSIARNTTTDFYRKRAKARDLHPDDLWHHGQEEAAASGLERCVLPFIASLQDEDAELLRAIDIEGMPQKDYARQHGISYSTLKSRVQSARRKLRKRFQRCCDFELDQNGALMDFHPKAKNCTNC